MKKILALVLSLCLLMTASFALAEGRLAQQDAAAPAAQTAAIYAADGNVIANLLENGTLVLTDVADRANDAALTAAFDAIMAAPHFSDACNVENANDLVITDLFSVALGDAASVLADGAYVEMTVPGVVAAALFSANGTEWTVAETVVNGNTTVIRLPQAGVVALLSQRAVVAPSTEPVVADPAISPAFTPSVSGKPAPAVVSVSGSVSSIGDLVVTAVSDRDYTNDVTTHEHLEWAFDYILTNDVQTSLAIAPEMQLVVRDLFEVSVYGASVDTLANGNVAVTFECGLAAGDTLVVIYSADAATWQAVPAENVVINNDGTVTVTLPALGAVAFLVEAPEDLPNADQAVSSPE